MQVRLHSVLFIVGVPSQGSLNYITGFDTGGGGNRDFPPRLSSPPLKLLCITNYTHNGMGNKASLAK